MRITRTRDKEIRNYSYCVNYHNNNLNYINSSNNK